MNLTELFESASIWDDNPLPVSGNTYLHLYENDSEFQNDGPRFAKWAVRRLGYPMVDIELNSEIIYTALEQAINDYTKEINLFNIRENIISVQGMPLTTDLTQNNVLSSFGQIIRLAQQYGSEVGAGGNIDWKSGSIELEVGTQDYDLNVLWRDEYESGEEIEIKRIFHFETPAASRYYDPYVDTGLGYNDVIGEFGGVGLTGTSPSISYILFPLYDDLLRIQAVEMNQQIRRSAYSFELINNKLRIFPIPQTAENLWFQYIVKSARTSGSIQTDVQSDPSNINYDFIEYSNINQPGKVWIWDYALQCVKESLGYVRSKYQNIPIPNADVTLDGESIKAEAITEREGLITQLREMLEETSRTRQLEKQQAEAEGLQEKLKKIPLGVWVR